MRHALRVVHKGGLSNGGRRPNYVDNTCDGRYINTKTTHKSGYVQSLGKVPEGRALTFGDRAYANTLLGF